MGDFRKNFGRVKKFLDIPNLIEIQTRSYEKFLQQELALAKRGNIGLQGAFKSVFPISDFSGKCSLEFVSYKIGDVRYNEKECIQKGMTFAAPLKIVVRLVVFDTDLLADGKINREAPEMKPIRDIKEQEIYFGEIPLMTENGTFIVNGTERVIVSQLHRSPGIFFDHDKARRTAPANSCTPRGSFRTAVRGWTSSSTRKTACSCVSTVVASCRPPCCCARSAIPLSKCWTLSTPPTYSA